MQNSNGQKSGNRVSSFWDNLDHISIMGTGGGFLGGMLVQLFGGGATQLLGAAIGMLAGGSYGWWSTVRQQRSRDENK